MIGHSKNKELLPYCLNFLGFISKEQQDLEKAMEFHQRAYLAAQEFHMKNIYEQLHVTSMTEAVARAIYEGLI